MSDYDVQAIDAVVNIFNAEALSHRPDWKDGFFREKLALIRKRFKVSNSTKCCAAWMSRNRTRIPDCNEVRPAGTSVLLSSAARGGE